MLLELWTTILWKNNQILNQVEIELYLSNLWEKLLIKLKLILMSFLIRSLVQRHVLKKVWLKRSKNCKMKLYKMNSDKRHVQDHDLNTVRAEKVLQCLCWHRWINKLRSRQGMNWVVKKVFLYSICQVQRAVKDKLHSKDHL